MSVYVWKRNAFGNWYTEGGGELSDAYERDLDTVEIERGFKQAMQQFQTGATRSADTSKIKPQKYTSPLATARFCQYMKSNEVQADGTRRDADNWKRGIPEQSYIDGLFRHTLDLQAALEGYAGQVYPDEKPHELDDILCAIWFNVQGLLHEREKRRLGGLKDEAERA